MRQKLRENWPLLAVVFLILAARSSLADHYVVPTGSMEHTLVPGDRVLVDKTAYGLRVPFTDVVVRDGATPQRGDVVIFDSPEDGTRLLKRVVAVGGDRVRLAGGRLEVNGVLQDEPALNLGYGGGPDITDTLMPAGQVLVLGDSRGNSRDGRFFGFLPADALYARALRIYYRSDDGFVWRPL